MTALSIFLAVAGVVLVVVLVVWVVLARRARRLPAGERPSGVALGVMLLVGIALAALCGVLGVVVAGQVAGMVRGA